MNARHTPQCNLSSPDEEVRWQGCNCHGALGALKERIDQLAYRCDRMFASDIELELERISSEMGKLIG